MALAVGTKLVSLLLYSILCIGDRGHLCIIVQLICMQHVPPIWGSLIWDSKAWLRVVRDSGHWVISLQTVDPSSRQRGHPTWRRQKSVKHKKIKIWSWAPRGCPTPRRTGRLIVGRKINLNPQNCMGCPVIHVSFFYETQRSGCFLPLTLRRKQTQFPKRSIF
jgi:hypothetical protein